METTYSVRKGGSPFQRFNGFSIQVLTDPDSQTLTLTPTPAKLELRITVPELRVPPL